MPNTLHSSFLYVKYYIAKNFFKENQKNVGMEEVNIINKQGKDCIMVYM